MTTTLLQLNINADNYWDKLISYLTSHDFDIINLQEVAGNETVLGNIKATRNVYAELQKILEEKYYGALSITQRFTSSPDAYFGNAIFYKKSFFLKEKNEIVLSKFDTFDSNSIAFENIGRTLLHLTFNIENRKISILNTHGAWGKNNIEKPYQTKQGEILVNYLKSIEGSFIVTGDFNLTPEQPLIQKINLLADNLTQENNITNTLDPKNHRAKQLFPEGLAVDYIFTSKDIHVKSFSVVDEGLSDHFGLTVEIEM